MRSFLLALVGGLTAGGVFIAYDQIRAWRTRRRFLKRLTEAVIQGIDKPGEVSAIVPFVFGKTVRQGIEFESDPEYFVRRVEP